MVIFSTLAGCVPQGELSSPLLINLNQTPTVEPTPEPLPTRPSYQPGTLVDYTAQMGDTLPALAAHFNTTVEEIRAANPDIPADATTMPAGYPMRIPIYYQAFWGNPYQIIPDNLFVNGPTAAKFDAVAYVDSQPGWFKNYSFFGGGETRRGGEIINYIATNYSLNPQMLLALVEYATNALTNPTIPENEDPYPFGYQSKTDQGLYRQLLWAAEILNNGYYGWRTGKLRSFEHKDGTLERPDPWQNAATVALQYFYSRTMTIEDYATAIYSQGYAAAFRRLFGDPWEKMEAIFPASLRQPALLLPFASGETWSFTGGPHTGYGEGEPYAALDFAPPALTAGCQATPLFTTAVADGVIVRSADAAVVLDLDGDGDERTGWVIFYYHIASNDRIAVGTQVKAGDPIGHPSCEGGRATGTHVHIARKYNGEWIDADSTLAFNLEGWIAHLGSAPYEGSLTRLSETVQASTNSDISTHITAGR